MRRRTRRLISAILAGTALMLSACDPEPPAATGGPEVADLLGGVADDGFARALAGTPLSFPRDHGPHPDYRTEWWYFTGNLDDPNGRHFGFQFTLFRFALAPAAPQRDSAWATRQIWMGHLAVSDPADGRFVFRERFSREAVGLAGGQANPLEIWLDDWHIRSLGDDFLPLVIEAGDTDVGLSLKLEPGKPRVLQGRDGLSAKGPEPGNASWYYSYTRLPATGRVRVGDESFDVAGTAWLDREWSTSALGDGVEGWDWFALQFDDATELMVYRLRRTDGSADPMSAGTLVDETGAATPLGAADVTMTVVETWTSPASGVRYPVAWSMAVPSAGLQLSIEPWQNDQEMDVSVRYWEGAIRVSGTRDGRPISGRGYLELAGYRPRNGSSSALPPR